MVAKEKFEEFKKALFTETELEKINEKYLDVLECLDKGGKIAPHRLEIIKRYNPHTGLVDIG